MSGVVKFIPGFIASYLVRAFLLSGIGMGVALLGLVWGLTTGLITLQFFGIPLETVMTESPSSHIEVGALQIAGLFLTSILFTLANSFLSSLPFIGSFSGFTNSITGALIEVGKALLLIAIPLTSCFVFTMIVFMEGMYQDNAITQDLRNAVIISSMAAFPMLMFYQISVEKLTM